MSFRGFGRRITRGGRGNQQGSRGGRGQGAQQGRQGQQGRDVEQGDFGGQLGQREAEDESGRDEFGVPMQGEPSTQQQPPASAIPTTYPAAYMQSEMYWDRLRNLAREALSNGQDTQLQSMLQTHFFALNASSRPSQNEVIALIANFLNVAHQRLEARHAALFLMQAGWDFEAAQIQYWAERAEELVPGSGSEELSNASIPSPTWSGGGSAVSFEPSGIQDQVSTPMDETSTDSEDEDTPQARMARLNTNVDRAPAMARHRDDSKLTIRLRNPDGKADTVQNYKKFLDWNDPDSVHELNRWRSQYHRRVLGKVREERIKLHYEEREYLINVHRVHALAEADEEDEVDWNSMDWDQITRDFNNHFQGRTLEGDSRVRPQRTENALRTARARIPEIVEMTGIKARGESKKGDGGKDEETGKGQKGNRRGKIKKRRGQKK